MHTILPIIAILALLSPAMVSSRVISWTPSPPPYQELTSHPIHPEDFISTEPSPSDPSFILDRAPSIGGFRADESSDAMTGDWFPPENHKQHHAIRKDDAFEASIEIVMNPLQTLSAVDSRKLVATSTARPNVTEVIPGSNAKPRGEADRLQFGNREKAEENQSEVAQPLPDATKYRPITSIKPPTPGWTGTLAHVPEQD
ncbi:hypothetical protein K431DRAFT_300657 [Polychaeton citri CBS 116435]|uniref:Uncharacterized protein n=1 Tax=Polychaeton citri CBS 116435 TaxID=1314669 RepID=A0A9P4QH40_9PEZI|nr:hypothetical protein K431DRAFT_300657 [Polychaeton citri CBS 116435]